MGEENETTAVRFDGEAYVRAHSDLVDLNSEFIRRFDGLDARIRKDANATAFLARQLVHQRGQIEFKIFEELRAAEFVPVESNHPRGAESYSTQLMTPQGKAKITHDLAGDSPRVDVDVDEDLRKYVNARASYAYTIQELEHAAFAGVPLPAWKGQACAEEIARKLDELGRIGASKLGLTGFFNNPLVTVHTLGNGEWNLFPTTTADQIIADLNELEDTLISQTRDTAKPPYTLVLPSAYEGILATSPRSSQSDVTIKEWFLRNSRLIKRIESYFALDGATGSDVAAADPPQAIVYKPDPMVLFWPIPILYEEQAPQLRAWEWVVDARARAGGVDVRRPSHMLYVENLD